MDAQQFTVVAAERGQTLGAVLKRRLGVSWSQARQLVEQRRVRIAGQVCTDAVRRLQTGQRVEIISVTQPKTFARVRPQRSAQTPKPVSPAPGLIFADNAIVVVEKPPGVTTMRHAEEEAEFGRGKRFLPPTLADALPKLLGGPVRAVHRLDRDTSGLVVFARTPEAQKHLDKQFRAHTIARKYLALVRGHAVGGRIESLLVRDRGDRRRGSAEALEGQRAVTHVGVVERLGDFTLVECRLETGRTHQVRIHLGEAGTPLCGETVYDRPLHGAPLPDRSGAPRLALHAALLGLHHPTTGEWLEWKSALPDDLETLLQRLRVGRPSGNAILSTDRPKTGAEQSAQAEDGDQ